MGHELVEGWGKHGKPRVAGPAKEGWKLEGDEKKEGVPGRWGGLSPSLLAPSHPQTQGLSSLDRSLGRFDLRVNGKKAL